MSALCCTVISLWSCSCLSPLVRILARASKFLYALVHKLRWPHIWAEIGRFCARSHITRPIIGAFPTLPFWILASGMWAETHQRRGWAALQRRRKRARSDYYNMAVDNGYLESTIHDHSEQKKIHSQTSKITLIKIIKTHLWARR